MDLKLGKREARPRPTDFLARSVMEAVAEIPRAPARFGHGLMFKDWGMLGNGPDDSVRPGFGGCGDCVIAGADHEHMLATKLGVARDARFTGAVAVSDYSAITGYVLGDDATDQGTYVDQAMSWRRKTGVTDSGGARHRIGAYLSVDPKDWELLMSCAWTFSAVGIGFQFPDSAMDQFDQGQTWDVVDGARIIGGHYVMVTGRSSRSVGGCVSWGRRTGFTRAFYEEYNDETWAIVFPEELRRNQTNERGLSLAQLNDMLGALTGV